MRVSQIQNLTWAGNVVVLAGLVWVGLQFWETKKAKASPEPVWPKGKIGAVDQRWPGELPAFQHIYTTPINGKPPPPPAPPVKVEPKVDRTVEFRAKMKITGGLENVSQPERSLARVNYDGKDSWIQPGNSVAGFQLVQFTMYAVKKPGGPPTNMARMVFRHPEVKDDVVIEQAPSNLPPLTSDDNTPVKRTLGPGVEPGPILETQTPDPSAFRDPETGHWIIPATEQLWIETFGEKNIWSKLATEPVLDAQGVARGVKFKTIPEQGTPLVPHGIGQGDVVVSINKVAVGSKEDILNYLRGDGKGLERYDVVIDTNGSIRTEVYVVRRARPYRVTRD